MSLADGLAWEKENPNTCKTCGGVVTPQWYVGHPLKKCMCLEDGAFGGFGDVYHDGGLSTRE